MSEEMMEESEESEQSEEMSLVKPNENKKNYELLKQLEGDEGGSDWDIDAALD